MGEILNIESYQASRECPFCECTGATSSYREQLFEYGEGATAAELKVRVPVWRCDECGGEFTDWRAEEARHDAVCDHLNRLRPSSIRALRERHDLSQEQLAELTGIGIASIKRWEAGNLIQGEAFDRYLRLLQFPVVYNELSVRVMVRKNITEPRFRTTLTRQMKLEAAQFSLRTSSGTVDRVA